MTFPCVLTIGGTDPSGGAGLTVDARACTAFGTHALPVVTAVVAQNTQGVLEWEAVSSTLLASQLDHLLSDITPQAVKTGLIPNAEAVKIIAARLEKLHVPIIVDPVFAPSSGKTFSDDETLIALKEYLIPICELVTPNWLELLSLNLDQLITNVPITDWQSDAEYGVIKIHAILFSGLLSQYVLLKGGDASEISGEACDLLCGNEEFQWFSAPRVPGIEVRGTGCMLASAIAAQRAQGIELTQAIHNAKLWLTNQIKNAQPIGKGRRVAV